MGAIRTTQDTSAQARPLSAQGGGLSAQAQDTSAQDGCLCAQVGPLSAQGGGAIRTRWGPMCTS